MEYDLLYVLSLVFSRIGLGTKTVHRTLTTHLEDVGADRRTSRRTISAVFLQEVMFGNDVITAASTANAWLWTTGFDSNGIVFVTNLHHVFRVPDPPRSRLRGQREMVSLCLSVAGSNG